MRLRPKWSAASLIIGKAVHEALGVWYKNPKISRQKFFKLLKQEMAHLEQEIQVSADYYDQEELDKVTSSI